MQSDTETHTPGERTATLELRVSRRKTMNAVDR
jgi:hypothetical protein